MTYRTDAAQIDCSTTKRVNPTMNGQGQTSGRRRRTDSGKSASAATPATAKCRFERRAGSTATGWTGKCLGIAAAKVEVVVRIVQRSFQDFLESAVRSGLVASWCPRGIQVHGMSFLITCTELLLVRSFRPCHPRSR